LRASAPTLRASGGEARTCSTASMRPRLSARLGRIQGASCTGSTCVSSHLTKVVVARHLDGELFANHLRASIRLGVVSSAERLGDT